LRAKGRVEQTRKLLNEIGIGGDRIDIFLLDPAQPHAFENATRQIKELIKAMGPSPLKKAGR
jgi:coenzyme F420-reducing hydrogenase delta subunit